MIFHNWIVLGLFLSPMLLAEAPPAASHEENQAMTDHAAPPAADTKTIVDEIRKNLSSPTDLWHTLKNYFDDDDMRKATALTEKIKKDFGFDSAKNKYPEGTNHSALHNEAIKGLKEMRAQYEERFNSVRAALRSDANPKMKTVERALRKHVIAVSKRYQEVIQQREANANDHVPFSDAGCAACDVGYTILNRSLRMCGLGRSRPPAVIPDKDKCPEDGAPFSF